MKTITRFYGFNHKLYGEAILLPNSHFNPTNQPTSICWRLVDEINPKEVKTSSISDTGHDFPSEVLERMGYTLPVADVWEDEMFQED